jgi:ATP/maltotriose-dependent transcriptional regulator MalT
MLETLLRTKLHVPQLRPDLVTYPRLVDRLDLGLQLGHKLILVSAPAGFGKTVQCRILDSHTVWIENQIDYLYPCSKVE